MQPDIIYQDNLTLMEISTGTYNDIEAITGFQMAMALESEGTILDPERICHAGASCKTTLLSVIHPAAVSTTHHAYNVKAQNKKNNNSHNMILLRLPTACHEY